MPSHEAKPSAQIDESEHGAGLLALWNMAALLAAWGLLLVVLTVIADQATVTGPAGMSLPRATFFVASAASLTGFETTWAAPERLTRVHATVWIIATAATALLSVTIATAAFARVSGRDWTWRRVLATAALFLIGAVVLATAGEVIGSKSASASAWNGLMIATGSGALSGGASQWDASLWVWRFPIAALAAIGPFVLIDTFAHKRNGRSISRVSGLTWAAVPITLLAAITLVVLVEALALDRHSVAGAATAAIDARGAGFTDSAAGLSHSGRWALVPVLLLGGASGGIGGGLKAITAAVVCIGVVRLLRGRSAGRTFAMAAVWLASLAALWFASFLLLMHFAPQLRADRAAILTAAAWGNAGVSVDPVGATAADAYVLTGAMLLGRALPWLLLWWSATRGDEEAAIG